MKKFTLFLIVGLATALTLVAAEKPATTDEAIAVNYVSVTDLFGLLKEAVPEGASAVVTLEMRTNTIVLDTEDPNYEAVRKLIEQIDQRPKQFIHRAVLTEIIRNGDKAEERVLSRPTVYCLEGRPAIFQFGLGGKELKLTVTTDEVKPREKNTAIPLAR